MGQRRGTSILPVFSMDGAEGKEPTRITTTVTSAARGNNPRGLGKLTAADSPWSRGPPPVPRDPWAAVASGYGVMIGGDKNGLGSVGTRRAATHRSRTMSGSLRDGRGHAELVGLRDPL